MSLLREIRLHADGAPPAQIRFGAGPNVVAGASDTGKSFLINCLDFALGADEMRRKILEAEPYTHVLVEFEKPDGQHLTLRRDFESGTLEYFTLPIRTHSRGTGQVIPTKRQGRQTVEDITSVLFPFFGMNPEALLRKNAKGDTQRLTIRTLFPAFVVDEASIIAEKSPMFGTSGFGETAAKRMLAYMLTGKDDSKVAASSDPGKDKAELSAKLDLAKDLLAEAEAKIVAQADKVDGLEDAIINVEKAISSITQKLDLTRDERLALQSRRLDLQRDETRIRRQISGLQGLLERYWLLNDRYTSDLERLDFIAEGTHFLGALDHAVCVYCGQEIVDQPHEHDVSGVDVPQEFYVAAVAEAAKIKGLQTDLVAAVTDISKRIEASENQLEKTSSELQKVDHRIELELLPEQRRSRTEMQSLLDQRLEYQTLKYNLTQRAELAALCQHLADELNQLPSPKRKWADLPRTPLRQFCDTIENILDDWSWPSEGAVEFDHSKFDLIVDGKGRQEHGKGVRSVLHAAFTIGLLKYCSERKMPHPGFVILDSPLTTYRQGDAPLPSGQNDHDEIDPTVEESFWKSLRSMPGINQAIILENKEPPVDISQQINYHHFAGPNASPGQRRGFVE